MWNLRRYLCMLLVLAGASGRAPAFASADAGAVSIHERRVQEDLERAQTAIAETTNVQERAVWERRAELARKALDNYRRLELLKAREQAAAGERKTSADYAVRRALSMIDSDVQAPERAIREINAVIRREKAKRGELEQAGPRDEEAARPSIFAARLAAYDAKVLALLQERDTLELKKRLAQEALRVDALRTVLDQNARITVRFILQKNRAAKRAATTAQEFTIMRADAGDQLRETCTAIAVATSFAAQIDEEISILEDRLKVEAHADGAAPRDAERDRSLFARLFGAKSRDAKQIQNMIELAKKEKTATEERIDHLRAQAERLTELITLIDSALELCQVERNFLAVQVGLLRDRYLRTILTPIGVVAGVLFVYLLISRVLFRFIFKDDSLFIARRLGSYLTGMLILLILIGFFLEDLKAIATVMGIVGAAIVIALQDLCSAFAGWFVIVTSRKFRIGDRVEIDGCRGEVIDIQMLRTTLAEINNWLGCDEPTGRTLIVPNSFIFKTPVFNYSHVHPFIWGKVDITITFETPFQAAYDALFKILVEEVGPLYEQAKQAGRLMAERYGSSHAILDPHIHTFIADSGITFSLFYVAHYRNFTAVRDQIMSRIALEFDRRPELNFAYPTQRHIPTPEGDGLAVRLAGAPAPGAPAPDSQQPPMSCPAGAPSVRAAETA
jgi:small-conductance mechanosensitive channel